MTERIVVAALLVALCGCARPNKPLGQVSDGIAVRLTADSRVWTEGEDPRFSVVLRNDSTQQLSTSLIASLALEIDGTPYAPLVWFSLGTIGNSPFGPGAQYAITLSLSYFGNSSAARLDVRISNQGCRVDE